MTTVALSQRKQWRPGSKWGTPIARVVVIVGTLCLLLVSWTVFPEGDIDLEATGHVSGRRSTPHVSGPDQVHDDQELSVYAITESGASSFGSFIVQLYWNHASLEEDQQVTVRGQGPHNVLVSASNLRQKNSNLPLLVQLEGPAVIPIPVSPVSSTQWRGSFELPQLDGIYQLKTTLGGCGTITTPCQTRQSKPIQVHSKRNNLQALSAKDSPSAWSKSLFPPNGVWISIQQQPQLVQLLLSQPPEQRYVWADPQILIHNGQGSQKWVHANTRGLTNDTDSHLLLSGTVLQRQESWYRSFPQLSNYEIVCWMGGSSAHSVWATFLSLRPQLFPSQRPFKFHYHPMTRLDRPDDSWNQEGKTKFRKCKHIFVLLDDDSFMETSIGDPLSAPEYRDRLVAFLRHLLRALPDPTFPIWMFGIFLESPHRARWETHHCYGGGDAPEHACNRVMADVWERRGVLFGPEQVDRIRYLDTADASALLGYPLGPRPMDVLGVIALRIYVLVGKQVQEWRQAGQQGLIDGLHRNGSVEPNFELIPYQWN